MTTLDNHVYMTTQRSEIDVICQDVFGYARRRGQSTDLLTVPAALIEEAYDSVPDGDGRSLLETILLRAERQATL